MRAIQAVTPCPDHPHTWRAALDAANAAPRCAARCRTRAHAPCRNPAMANGRCRMHGGGSTGPRTAGGRERCRRAHLRHGGRSMEWVGLRRESLAVRRELRRLIGLADRRLADDPRPAGLSGMLDALPGTGTDATSPMIGRSRGAAMAQPGTNIPDTPAPMSKSDVGPHAPGNRPADATARRATQPPYVWRGARTLTRKDGGPS